MPPPRLITYKGETRSMCSWALLQGISPAALKKRLNSGWSVEKALETPMKIYKTRSSVESVL